MCPQPDLRKSMRPKLVVVAGPNGSGKSTLIAKLMRAGVEFGRYINADDIAREAGLSGEDGSREAQRRADALREDCLTARADFSFETVMSHASKIEFMEKAATAGYKLVFYFVATQSPELNILRVGNRVALGGHDVPADRIVARYHRTLALLPSALKIADEAALFDNGIEGDPMKLVLQYRGDTVEGVADVQGRLPPWAQDALAALKKLQKLKVNFPI